MRRVIGIDIHRTFGEVVFWEDGRLRRAGRIDMTRTALEGFGKTLLATDEVVIEATANSMAVSRVLAPFVAGNHRQSAAGEGDRSGTCKD
jgi:transposase